MTFDDNPVIQRLGESRRLGELLIKQAGEKVYDELDENERTVLRFGMLPAGKTEAAEKALLAEHPDLLEQFGKTDVGRIMAVAAMDACNQRGDGMVV